MQSQAKMGRKMLAPCVRQISMLFPRGALASIRGKQEGYGHPDQGPAEKNKTNLRRGTSEVDLS